MPYLVEFKQVMEERLEWEQSAQDPASVSVRFHSGEAHARLWQLFQSRGFGVAAPYSDPYLTTSDAPPERTRVLSLPEAFYLLTATQWLAAPLGSYAETWDRFSTASPQLHFQRHFVAHFHLRERGWILRSGLNYGGHFVLYRGATSAFHSEYIAYVKEEAVPLAWGVLQALTRVAADAKKTVLVCDVSCGEQAARRSDGGREDADANSLTRGAYEFFGLHFRFSAVAIRFWDVAAAEARQSFAFQPQPVLRKKPTAARRTQPNKRQ